MILLNNDVPIILPGSIDFNKGLFINSSNIDLNQINSLFKGISLNEGLIPLNINNCSNNVFKIAILDNQININGTNINDILLSLTYLRSLIEKSSIQRNGYYSDHPKYNHREFMLDLARNHFTIKEIKKIIDELFINRINYLHLHLSDDQNYCLESKSHPILNNSFYYTDEQIKDLIKYCSLRGIEIIPEIDLPGHMNYILDCYPKLRCANSHSNSLCFGKGFSDVIELLSEVSSLFPGKYIHIGGDEVDLRSQKKCRECNNIMNQLSINHLGLVTNYINILDTYLNSLGKKTIVWADTLKYGKLNEDIIVQKWYDFPFDKTIIKENKKDRQFIIGSTINTYFDYPYSLIPLQATYEFIPQIGNETPKNIIGISSHMWTECPSSNEDLEKHIFPRLQAFAENSWVYHLDYQDFLNRIKKEIILLNQRGISTYPLDDIDDININEIKEFIYNKLKIKQYGQIDYLTLSKLVIDFINQRIKYKKDNHSYVKRM